MFVKKVAFLITCILAVFVIGCSNNETELPTTQLDKYIVKWEEADFTSMYDMLSDDAKDTYTKEDFIDRYEKIYTDLEIKNLSISYKEPDKEVLKKAKSERTASIPLEVTMDSMAGPIDFSNEITLTLQESKEDKKVSKWLIDWDSSLIFPDLKDDAKVSVLIDEPKRGEIIDVNQMPLALNDLAYEVGVVPNLFENEEKEKQEIARLLNMSVEAIEKALNEDWVQPEHFIPLKTIPKNAENTLSQLTQLPAVQTKDTTGRNYPAGEAAAHLTGYVGKITADELEKAPAGQYTENDLIGKAGLEKMYEEQLRGEQGVKIVITKKTTDGVEEEVVLAEKPVKNGEHVQVTIDVNVQEKIYNTYKKKNISGTAAAVHPKTGEVLALISSPAYDPNELTFGITQGRWDSLMDDPKKPFVNRFASTYAPGSVFKPITAAIGLKEGTITHSGAMEINGLKWGKEGWNNRKVTRVSTSNGPVDLRDALQRSDNIYFARQAVAIGHTKYEEGLRQFGFEEKFPFSFPIKASRISNSGDLKDELLLAHSSYGQGEIEMSSLHIALAYTAFLNEGNIIKPILLEDEQEGEVWLEDVISAADAKEMQEYLRGVVTKGTGKAALDENLAISGKTGTVELKQSQDSKGHENGWFIGYPTDNPDMVIAMMMEHTENQGTSSFVAENVKNILVDLHK